jgi:acetyl-CoA decarbonylase/synthase complex subunit gamma
VAIKGTDIVKKLPEAGKKNCRECGLPTCFAFAMKLAAGGIELNKCPYLSEEVKAELEDALSPPIRLVKVGTGNKALEVGDEQVLYRHEKTFIHPPGISVLIDDTEPEHIIDEKITGLKQMQFNWVGKLLRADMLAVRYKSGDRHRFESLLKRVISSGEFPVVIISEDDEVMLAAYKIYADLRPLIYPVTEHNIEKIISEVKKKPIPVGVRAGSVEALAPLTLHLKEHGVEDIFLDPGSNDLQSAVRDQTLLRRSAIKHGFRPLGYPTIAFPCFMTDDRHRQILLAATYIIKYAGIIVLDYLDENSLLPLLVQRMNVYTDPRIPMSMEEKIYPINNPDDNSPVLITTNWALTYFLVSSEIENSKVPSWLCVKETGGLGVLTAWAAGKFNGDTIAPFIKKCDIESKVNHRRLIIPGRVARIRHELSEALPEWEIIVGPGDANEIPAYLPELIINWKK